MGRLAVWNRPFGKPIRAETERNTAAAAKRRGNGLQPEPCADASASTQGRAAGQLIAGPRGRFWVKKRQKRARQHTPFEKKDYLYTT